uniref:Uncharacterized protein n=1 Tax=Kryptolebias marmoratus TaxID=37003 RepID=A0A3Q2ZJV4_KRYMA
MALRALLVFVSCLQFVVPASSTTDPAKCVVVWTFTLPCSEPVTDLVKQLKSWSSKKCRDGSERCMYEITKESVKELEVKHTSPQTGKITNINFMFTPPAAMSFCKVKAISTAVSQNTTSPNDYCLLHNLIDGSGLTEASGYKEICNQKMCPSKPSANCNKEGFKNV